MKEICNVCQRIVECDLFPGHLSTGTPFWILRLECGHKGWQGDVEVMLRSGYSKPEQQELERLGEEWLWKALDRKNLKDRVV